MTVRPDVFHLEEIAELIEDGECQSRFIRKGVFNWPTVAPPTSLPGRRHCAGKLVLDCRD